MIGTLAVHGPEGGGLRACAPLNPLPAEPNVTAHLSTASVPITVLLYDARLLCGFNVAIKGLSFRSGYGKSSAAKLVFFVRGDNPLPGNIPRRLPPKSDKCGLVPLFKFSLLGNLRGRDISSGYLTHSKVFQITASPRLPIAAVDLR